jgi:hypothetical protein
VCVCNTLTARQNPIEYISRIIVTSNYSYVRIISSKAAPLPGAVTPEVAGRGGVERAVGGTGSFEAQALVRVECGGRRALAVWL